MRLRLVEMTMTIGMTMTVEMTVKRVSDGVKIF